MSVPTTIAAGIDVAADKARYDHACKQLLAEKIILAWIMKSTMKEYASVSVQEIAEKYIAGTPQIAEVPVMPDETNSPRVSGTGVEDSTITEGKVTFDIRFPAILPATSEQIRIIINVEAQNDFYPGYPLLKRGVYYGARMISSQYGTEFTNSHYEKIKKVYSVWICMNPPKYRQNTINSYSIAETNIIGSVPENPENYDLLTVIMICLGSQNETDPNGILRLLDVLLSSDMDTTTKKKILSADFDIPMTQQFERRINEMCNLSDGVLEKGYIRGIEKGMLTSIQNLMETMHLSAEQAMDALKVPVQDRTKYVSFLSAKENEKQS